MIYMIHTGDSGHYLVEGSSDPANFWHEYKAAKDARRAKHMDANRIAESKVGRVPRFAAFAKPNSVKMSVWEKNPDYIEAVKKLREWEANWAAAYREAILPEDAPDYPHFNEWIKSKGFKEVEFENSYPWG